MDGENLGVSQPSVLRLGELRKLLFEHGGGRLSDRCDLIQGLSSVTSGAELHLIIFYIILVPSTTYTIH